MHRQTHKQPRSAYRQSYCMPPWFIVISIFKFSYLLFYYSFTYFCKKTPNLVLHRLKNNQENGFKTYRCPCILIGRHEHKWLKLQAHCEKLRVLWDMKMQSIMRNFMISKCRASRWAKTSSRMFCGRWLCGQFSPWTPSERQWCDLHTLNSTKYKTGS